MVEDRGQEQSVVARRLRTWAPAVALAVGVALLAVRSELHVRVLRDALHAFAYGAFTFGVVDAAERVLRGLGWVRPHRAEERDLPTLPQARDGSRPLSSADRG